MVVAARGERYSRVILSGLLLTVMTGANAEENGSEKNNATTAAALQKKATRPKVAVVLSGGGARGLAHVGVFKALEKMRIPYDCIVGTSMGAVAGGAFATGITVAQAEEKVVNADWRAIFADKPKRSDIPYFRKYEDYRPYFDFTLTLKNFKPFTPRNFVGAQHIDLFFRELTGARSAASFDDLPVPYRAVGTDIVTGKPVLLSSGSVAQAMRASMTVPGVFPPLPYQGHLLVDGGLAMNLPVSVGKKLCGEVVIAVNAAAPSLKKDQLLSFLNIGEQVINIGMEANMNEEISHLSKQDVLIIPGLDGYASTDFEKVKELIGVGEKAVEDSAELLRPLQVSAAEYTAWREAIEARKPPLPVINNVHMAKMNWVNAEVMNDLLKVRPGNEFDMAALHENISRVYARGDFSGISYELVNTGPGKANILLKPEEKPGRDFVRFGLGLYTNFQGDAEFGIIASLRRAWLNRLDAEWRTDVQLGRDNSLYSEWYQPASLGSEFFVAPYLLYVDQYNDRRLQNIARLEYEYQQAGGGLELGSVFGRWGEFRIGVTRSQGSVEAKSLLDIPDEHYQQGGYTLRTVYDQLDNTYFPHKGSSARLSYFKSSTDMGADTAYDRLEFSAAHAYTRKRNTVLLRARVGSSMDSALPFYNAFSLGGIFNLSAYPQDYFQGGELLFAGAILSRRISNLPTGLGQGVYAGTALEAGRVRANINGDADNDNVAFSGSLFLAANTVLGPFYLLGAVGDNNKSALYLALGVSF